MGFWDSDKLPAVLTLLIGVFVWQFTALINHEWNAPLLTYRQEATPAVALNDTVSRNECRFTLTNRSQTTIFHNLLITAMFRTHDGDRRFPEPRKIPDAEMVTISPAALVDSPCRVFADSEGVQFVIPAMLPGNSYELRMTVLRNIAADEYPRIYLKNEQPIEFRLHDKRDWVLENLFAINLCLLGFWICLIIIYIIKQLKKKQP